MNVTVDRDKCIGAANCVAIASTVFELDDEMRAFVLDPNSVDEEILRMAADACPVQAIILEGD